MRRLNVRKKHLQACIKNNKFAVNSKLNLKPKEILLFQVVKVDLLSQESRISAYMIFDNIYPDSKQESKSIWNESYNYIITGTVHELAKPFNIESIIGIGEKYQGQTQGAKISSEDELKIEQHLK